MRELDLAAAPAERVLVVGAHPDDAEFSAGGTLARLIDAGACVTLIVCTDGARGGRGLDDPVRVRAAEQARAAKALGIQQVTNLGWRDGELSCGEPLIAALVREIRAARPDLVLTHDPTTLWTTYGSRSFLGHSDHRASGQATLDALYPRAGSPNFYREQLEAGLEPWSPAELWLFDTREPDARVEIGAALERKLRALEEHASQRGSAGGLPEAARALAFATGSPGRPAEAFRTLRLGAARDP